MSLELKTMLSWLRSIRQTLPRLQLPDTGSLDERDVTAEYVTMSFLIFEKIRRINLLDNKVAKINGQSQVCTDISFMFG